MKDEKKLCVVMPAYNEESTIEEIIEKVIKEEVVGRLIVINDCSTDSTPMILKKFEYNNKILIIHHDVNKGKGTAIKSATKHINCEYVVIQDADLEYDPSQYNKLLNPLLNGLADVVYGSRFQTGEERRVLYFWHYVGNQFLTLLSNAFTNINLTDMETCFKIMKSDFFRKLNLQEKRFGVEPEITAKLAAMDARFYEVSISYFGRTYAEGKKIKASDGFRALFCIIYYNSYWQKKKYSRG